MNLDKTSIPRICCPLPNVPQFFLDAGVKSRSEVVLIREIKIENPNARELANFTLFECESKDGERPAVTTQRLQLWIQEHERVYHGTKPSGGLYFNDDLHMEDLTCDIKRTVHAHEGQQC